jgi:hypothetical protein
MTCLEDVLMSPVLHWMTRQSTFSFYLKSLVVPELATPSPQEKKTGLFTAVCLGPRILQLESPSNSIPSPPITIREAENLFTSK